MAFKWSFEGSLNHRSTSNNTLTCIVKLSKLQAGVGIVIEQTTQNNLVVISKSYIEKTKAFTLSNTVIKALKKFTKARQSRKLIRGGTFCGDKRRCAKTQKNNNEPIGYVKLT